MAQLHDLIGFIRENPPSSERFWTKRDWEVQLTESIPSWRDLVTKAFEAATEWQNVEKARPKKDNHNLCEVLVGVIGLRLARRWCQSTLNDRKENAAEWLSENLSLWDKFDNGMRKSAIDALIRRFGQRNSPVWNLNATIWRDLDNTTKSKLLTALYRAHPGEPFESQAIFRRELYVVVRELRGAKCDRIFPPSATCTGYVPSPEADHLGNIMRDIGDDEWLAGLDKMNSTREKACRTMMQPAQHVRYALSRNERELVARLLEITRASGYLAAPLPSILVSHETPPIFVAYPDLEDESDGVDTDERHQDRDDRVLTNREREQPDVFPIEELLGVYQPWKEQIVIFERGINWAESRFNFDSVWLRSVVLVHEIAHWITHALPHSRIRAWPTDLYIRTAAEVHEGWAQLMTYWIADQVGGKFEKTFKCLNRQQSLPYHVYRRFESESKEDVMASLQELRCLQWPARLDDWRMSTRGT